MCIGFSTPCICRCQARGRDRARSSPEKPKFASNPNFSTTGRSGGGALAPFRTTSPDAPARTPIGLRPKVAIHGQQQEASQLWFWSRDGHNWRKCCQRQIARSGSVLEQDRPAHLASTRHGGHLGQGERRRRDEAKGAFNWGRRLVATSTRPSTEGSGVKVEVKSFEAPAIFDPAGTAATQNDPGQSEGHTCPRGPAAPRTAERL
mmetsp:Transcript_9090/g.20146  ORF Transcript_9090/g.20146 Transcript_9090/m.20146 type:complete len:205 (+) Transcript_9090:1002-1616(+)